MLGVIPPGYGWSDRPVSLATYFALARGSRGTATEQAAGIGTGVAGAGNDQVVRHQLPLFGSAPHRGSTFQANRKSPAESGSRGGRIVSPDAARAAWPGKLPYALQGDGRLRSARSVGHVMPAYARVLRELAEANVAWVQIDEPVIALDLTEKSKVALALAYSTLGRGPTPEILLASYFGPLGSNLATAAALPVTGLHLDLVRGGTELDAVVATIPTDRWLSLGVVDGRNVWHTDLRTALGKLQKIASARSTRRLMVAPSCSLLHVPIDLGQETKLDPEVKSWLAFAEQKLEEIATLAGGLDEGEAAIKPQLAASDAAIQSRRTSRRVHRDDVQARLAAVTPQMQQRGSPYTRAARCPASTVPSAAFSDHHDRLLSANR